MATMTPEQMQAHVRHLAASRCRNKHPHLYDEMICVGPGSNKEFSPPCDNCITEVENELAQKRGKMQGRELSPEEIERLRRELEG